MSTDERKTRLNSGGTFTLRSVLPKVGLYLISHSRLFWFSSNYVLDLHHRIFYSGYEYFKGISAQEKRAIVARGEKYYARTKGKGIQPVETTAPHCFVLMEVASNGCLVYNIVLRRLGTLAILAPRL